jgi:hypothetical protein
MFHIQHLIIVLAVSVLNLEASNFYHKPQK